MKTTQVTHTSLSQDKEATLIRKITSFQKFVALALVLFHAWTFSMPHAFADGPVIMDAQGNVVSGGDGTTTNADLLNGEVYTCVGCDSSQNETWNISVLNDLGIADEAARAIINIEDGRASVWEGVFNLLGTLGISNVNGFQITDSFQANVAGGLLMTTLGISQSEFFAGMAELSRNPNTDPAAIFNSGQFNVADGGWLALIAAAVQNTGNIFADGATAVIAAGDAVTMDISGNGQIAVEITEAVDADVYDFDGNKISDQIANNGTIRADGGVAVLTARGSESIFDNIINLEGVVQANSISEQNGQIIIHGGDEGIVRVNGDVFAKGDDAGETGGEVQVLGDKVGLFGDANVDVSGWSGGGDVYIGGDYQGLGNLDTASVTYIDKWAQINADATVEGDGGRVIVWADDTTRAYGTITARGGVLGGNGGFIETSGKNYLDVSGSSVSAHATHADGEAGTWLLDPRNVSIVAGAGSTGPGGGLTAGVFTPSGNDATIGADDIVAALDAGTNVEINTGTTGTQDGTITVASSIAMTANPGMAVQLLLTAARSVVVQAGNSITAFAGAALNVILRADNDGNGTGDVQISANIDTQGGTFLAETGQDFEVNNGASITTGGGSFTANVDKDADGTGFFRLRDNSSIVTSAGNAMITTADMNISDSSGGTIDAGAGTVTIETSVAGRTIGLGGGSGDLNINDTEGDNITANQLTIGNTDSGSIGVNNFSPDNVTTLLLRSSGTVTESASDAAADLTVTNLAINADDGVNIDVDVTNLSVQNDAAGGIDLTDTSGGMTIGDVAGLSGASSVGGNIALVAMSPLVVNSDVVNSGGGDITLTASGTDDLTLDAEVTASGGNGTIHLNGGNSILQNSGNVTVAGAGVINYNAGQGTATGAITMASGATASSDTGNINMSADQNIQIAGVDTNSGTIDIESTGGDVTLSDGEGGVSSTGAGSITVSATGTIDVNDSISAGAGGSVTLEDAANLNIAADIDAGNDVTIQNNTAVTFDGTGDQSVDADTGTLSIDSAATKTTAGNLTLGGDAAIDLDGNVQVNNGQLVLDDATTAAGDLIASGDLTLDNDITLDGAGAQRVDSTGGTLTVTTVNKANGDLTLAGGTAIDINTTVDLDNGSLTIEDAFNANGNLIASQDLTLSGAATLDGAAQRIDAEAGTLMTQGISKATAGDITLGGGTAIDLNGTVDNDNGALTIEDAFNASGNLIASTDVTLSGAATLDGAAQRIDAEAGTLNTQGLDKTGTSSLTLGGATAIDINGDVDVQPAAGTLTIEDDFTASGDLESGLDMTFGGSATFDGAGNQEIDPADHLQANAISKTTAGDLAITGTSADINGTVDVDQGSLTVNASAILAGDVIARDDITLNNTTSGNQIQLDGAVDQLIDAETGALNLITGVDKTAAGKLTISGQTGIDANGDLEVDNGELVIDNAANVSANIIASTNVTAQGLLTLDGAGNQSVEATGGNITLAAGLLKAANNATLTSGGNINQTGGTTTVANLEFSSGGTVTLNEATNNFGTIAGTSNGTQQIRDVNAITIGSVGAQTGLTSGGNDITVTAGGDVQVNEQINAAAGNVTIDSAGEIDSNDEDGTADIIGATIDLTADAGGIGNDNSIEVTASVAVNADTTNDDGEIVLDSIGDLLVGLINAGTGEVDIVSTGAIDNATAPNGAANLIGGEVTLEAEAGGIGTTSILEVTSTDFNADTTNDDGNILVNSIGNFPVGTIDAGAGDVTLHSTGNITDVNDNDDVNVTGGTIDLTAQSGGIGEMTDYFDIAPADVFNADTSADNGDQFIRCVGDCPLGQVDVGTGNFGLQSTGTIRDGNDLVSGEHAGGTWNITAGGVVLEGGTGVGEATNALELRLSDFGGTANTDGRAELDGGTGGIYISNAAQTGAGLTLGGVGALANGANAADDIVVESNSPLTISSAVASTAGGDITLFAAGNAATDDLTINANITASGGDGNINLFAGDSLSAGNSAVVSAAGAGDIQLRAGEDFLDGTIDQDGNAAGLIDLADQVQIQATNGEITADSATSIALSSLQTASNAANAVTVNARNGAITDNGNTHVDIQTGSTGTAVLDATAGVGSGNALETSIGNLDVDNTTSGNIEIDEIAAGVDLGINEVDQDGAGTVVIRTLDGTLAVNAGQSGVAATTGEITLSAGDAGASGDDNLRINDTVTSTTGKINLDSAANDVIFTADGDVTSTSGEIEIDANDNVTMVDGTILNAGDDLIDIDAGATVAIGQIITTNDTADAVNVDTDGNITDAGNTGGEDIQTGGTNGEITLSAATGIGDGNAIEISSGRLDLINTTSGNVAVDETNTLGILRAVQQGTGNLTIRDLGGLLEVIAEATSGFATGVSATSGETTLAAVTNNLNVFNDVESTSGKINLDAGTFAQFGGDGDVTSTSGEIEVEAGTAGGGDGDILMTDTGAGDANNTIFNAGSGIIDLDASRVINISSIQTTSNAANAVDLNAGLAIQDQGDTEVDIVTGTTGEATLLAGGGIGSGNAIETSIGNLDAQNTGTGNLEIDEVASGGALNVLRADQQGAGDLTVRTLDGTLTVVDEATSGFATAVSATAGETTLAAQDAGNSGNDNLVVKNDVAATTGKVNLDGANDVQFAGDGDVTTTSGEIEVEAGTNGAAATGNITMTDTGAGDANNTILNAGDDILDLDATGSISISSLQTTNTGTTAIDVNAGNAITDAGDTEADLVTGVTGEATLLAANGIGSGNAIETSIGNLDALNSTANNLEIDEVATGGALNILRAIQQGAGDLITRTLDGTLTVIDEATSGFATAVSATTGETTLAAQDAGNSGNDNLVVNNDVTATTGKVNLDGANDVQFAGDGDVTTTSGEIEVEAGTNGAAATGNITMTDTGAGDANNTILNAGDDILDLDATGSISISSLQTTNTGTTAIDVNAGNAITDAGDTEADLVTGVTGEATILAANGIGSGNALETNIGNLDARNTTANNIEIDELAAGGDLNILRVHQEGAGDLTVRTLDGTLTVVAEGTSGFTNGVQALSGETTLAAQDAGNSGSDNLVVNNDVTATTGKVNLDGANDVNFAGDGDVTTTSGEIEVEAGTNGAAATGDINMTDTGAGDANNTILNAGDDLIDLDATGDINISSVQTTNDTATAVDINAGDAVTDVGDTEVDIVTGATNGEATILAANGIGHNNAMETSIGRLDARNTTSNDIEVDEVAAGGALGVLRVHQEGAGDIVVRTLDGTLTLIDEATSGFAVGSLANVGETFLQALDAGNSGNDNVNVNNDVEATTGKVNIDGANDVNFAGDGDVTTTSGEIEVEAGTNAAAATGDINMTDTGAGDANNTILNAGDDLIDLDARGDINISSVQTTNDTATAVDINAGDAVTDVGDTEVDIVTGATNGEATILAANGIGHNNAMETSIGRLDARNTTSNDIEIDEVVAGADLGVLRVHQEGAGDIVVRTLDGSLTIIAEATSGFAVGSLANVGETFLQALDAGNSGNDNVNVNNDVEATTGKVNIDGANDVNFAGDGDVTTTSGEIEVEAGTNAAAATGDINMTDTGAGDANNTILNAGDDLIDLDATGDINISSVQTTNNGTTAVDINSGDQVTDVGDTEIDIVTGATGEATILAVNGIGSGTGSASATPGSADTNQIETSIGNLDARNTTSNHIQIDEVAAGGALGVLRVHQEGAGDLVVRTLDGTLTVIAEGTSGFGNGIAATSGETVVQALDAGASGSDNLLVNNDVLSTTGKINLDATNDVRFAGDGDVTSTSGEIEVEAGQGAAATTGDITMTDNGAGDDTVLNAGSGQVDLDALRNITLSSVQTTNTTDTAIVMHARNGSIIDGGDTALEAVTGASGGLVMNAQTGIGNDTDANDGLETDVDELAAVTETGDIQVFNTGTLEIKTIADDDTTSDLNTNVDAGNIAGAVITDAGAADALNRIFITSTGAVTVTSSVINNDAGNVTVAALGNTGDRDLNVNADILSRDGNGDVRAIAGADVIMAANTTIGTSGNGTGTGDVFVAAGEDWTGDAHNAALARDGLRGGNETSDPATAQADGGGGDVIMDVTSTISTEDVGGDITVEAADDIIVGLVTADSDGDDNRGDVTTLSESGSTLDAGAGELDFKAETLTMTSGALIGTFGNAIEIDAPNLFTTSVGSQVIDAIGDTKINMLSTNGSIKFRTTGDINVDRAFASEGHVELEAYDNIESLGGSDVRVIGADISLTAGGTIGRPDNQIHTQLSGNAGGGGTLTLVAGQQSSGLSANVTGNFGASSVNVGNTPPGLVFFNNATVVGGALLPGLTTNQSSLYQEPIPSTNLQYAQVDGENSADFPGFFNQDNFSAPGLFNIDVSGIDFLPSLEGVEILPGVLPLPISPLEGEEEGTGLQQDAPPVIVPIPEDSMPNQEGSTGDQVVL